MQSILETIGGPASLAILGIGYFGMVIAERLYYAVTRRSDYDNRDALTSIGINLITSLIGILVGLVAPLALYVFVFEHFRLTTIETLWLAVPVAFVVNELTYYIDHRLNHRVGLMWAFHSVHHSSNEFNHTTAARGFYLDGRFKMFGASVAALLGVPPVIYVAVHVLKDLYGIWNHASYVGHLGWLERIFATPLNHKIHHANQPEYIDKNYSQVLIVWDRMLGTHAPYSVEPVVGLVEPLHDYNPITAQLAGIKWLARRIRSAERWQDKLAYLWRPPEWSHDGRCSGTCPKYARPEVTAAE